MRDNQNEIANAQSCLTHPRDIQIYFEDFNNDTNSNNDTITNGDVIIIRDPLLQIGHLGLLLIGARDFCTTNGGANKERCSVEHERN